MKNIHMKKVLRIIMAVVILAAGILYSFFMIQPTSRKNKNLDQAGYTKTYEHLSHIAAKPHPIGSTAIGDVRTYLEEQFEKLGIDYVKYPFNCYGLTLVDYLVKVDAPDNDEGVMFVSHYDSVKKSYGASDDGISVASMLTVLEEVVTRKQNKNDMYFLFTDGEEIHMNGSSYFVNECDDELQGKIKAVLNFDARGSKGTLLMYETGNRNYGLINMLKRAVNSGSTPISFGKGIYKQMPNYTDFTLFINDGYTGMNFAMISGSENYHRETDTIENLNEDSAAMYYLTVSELAKSFENVELSELNTDDNGVYFPIAKGRFFLCKESTMNVFSIVVMIAFLALAVFAMLKKEIILKNVKRSLFDLLLISVFSLLGSGVLSIVEKIIFLTAKNPDLHSTVVLSDSLYLAQMVLVAAISIIYLAVSRKKQEERTIQDLLFLYGCILFVLSVVTFIVLRDFTYIFSISLLVLMIIAVVGHYAKTYLLLSIPMWIVMATITIPVMFIVYQSLLMNMTFIYGGAIYALIESFMFSLVIKMTGGRGCCH